MLSLISGLLPQGVWIHTESFKFNRFWVRDVKYLICTTLDFIQRLLLRQLEVKATMLSLVYCYNGHWKTIIAQDRYIYIWWCIQVIVISTEINSVFREIRQKQYKQKNNQMGYGCRAPSPSKVQHLCGLTAMLFGRTSASAKIIWD